MILAKEPEIIYAMQYITLFAKNDERVHIIFFAVIYIRSECKKMLNNRVKFSEKMHSKSLSKNSINNQKKKVQKRLFTATLIQNNIVKIIDARNTIPVPQAKVRSTPSKSMQ